MTTSAADDDRRVLAPGRRSVAIGLVMLVTLVAFEALAVNTVMPIVKDDLDGIRLYGWAFSAFVLTQLVGIVIAGRDADAHGPARPFARGLVLFGAGLLVAGAAPNMAVLVAGRALQGLGAGHSSSVAYVSIGRGFPPTARARMLAVMSSAWVLPGLIGPPLSATVAEELHWRWVFVGLVPILPVTAAMALPGLRRLAPHADADVGRPAIASAALLSVGAGVLLAGLASSNPLLAVVAVPLGLAIGLPRFRQLVPEGTLRARAGLPAAIAVRGLITFAFFGTDFFLPLALTDVRGQRPRVAGLVVTAAAISWALGSWMNSRINRRIGHAGSMRLGLAILTAGIAGVATVLGPLPVFATPFVWAIAGMGMGFAYQGTTLAVLEEAPPGQEGRASAAVSLTDTLGVALGAGLGGSFVALAESMEWPLRHGLGAAFTTTTLVAALGLVAISRTSRRGSPAAGG